MSHAHRLLLIRALAALGLASRFGLSTGIFTPETEDALETAHAGSALHGDDVEIEQADMCAYSADAVLRASGMASPRRLLMTGRGCEGALQRCARQCRGRHGHSSGGPHALPYGFAEAVARKVAVLVGTRRAREGRPGF